MNKIVANKKTLIRWKIYIDRARMYIGYIQFIMIGFLLIKSYKDTNAGVLIFDHLWLSIPILFILFILLSLIIGRLDTVFGLREEELRNLSTSNPMMREIYDSIRDIKNDIRDLKK